MRRLNVVNRKRALKVVKELDAFPKVPENYQESTPTGGGVSILVFVAIGILIVSEFRYYSATELKYAYAVDTETEGKLKINVDMTVAMKCHSIGADVLDLTGQTVENFGRLQETPTYFELSPRQRDYMDMVKHVNDYIKNEYHAVHELLWKSGFSSNVNSMPDREDSPDKEPDACRLTGVLEVNRVAGNFHITAGKVLYGLGTHMHLTTGTSMSEYNFTHRIHSFSYGEETAGIVNPLDGEEKVTKQNMHMYQYFIQVVPTIVETDGSKVDTFQYSVTEKNRTIEHSKGSHGVPGIFVKYDMSFLKVHVKEEHKPYWQFLVRMCGIVGGIFATSGMLHALTGFAVDCICCRFRLGKYQSKEQTAVYSKENNALLNDAQNCDSAGPRLAESVQNTGFTLPGASLVSQDFQHQQHSNHHSLETNHVTPDS